MSDTKISELPVAASLDGSEVVPVVQAGETVRVSIELLRTSLGSATEAPTTGAWLTGQSAYNSAPGYGTPVGWVCVSPGTPGTWLPMSFLFAPAEDVTGPTGTVVAASGVTNVDYAGSAVITLPSAAEMVGYEGKEFLVKDTSGNASETDTITFDAGVGTTLEYAYSIISPLGAMTWYLDGSVWRAK